MGIKHFFKWFKSRFPNTISNIGLDEKIESNIDNLMIDMNGIFHTSAQKIYQYGNFKPLPSLLRPNIERTKKNKDELVFKDICSTIDTILAITNPRKRLVLCVDGPAPLSKQNQQRQRRFISDNKCSFDSNCITPGTEFMNKLSVYIDNYIKYSIEHSFLWKGLEVVFSNEKTPGEGEHKLINFIRKCGNMEENYCIYGMDADLIMLSLGTHIKKFWILRDSIQDYYLIDIGLAHHELANELKWENKNAQTNNSKTYDENTAIDDFILMCFTVGNDFLPHIPAIEILEGGIDFMIDVYKTTCSSYGHLTRKRDNTVQFRKPSFTVFLGTVSQYEKGILETKLQHKGLFFPDPLLEEYKDTVNIEKYRDNYNRKHFGDTSLEKVCHEYLKGVQWVLKYYIYGVPDWKWRYPFHYAPFSFSLASYIKTYTHDTFMKNEPNLPFVQLLSVLPPKSSSLLPKPLDKVLTIDLKEFCPETVTVDLSGKRQDWEGIVILPMIDYNVVEELFKKNENKIKEKDINRNIIETSFIYNGQTKTPIDL